MTALQAISRRVSRRSYLKTPIDERSLEALQERIDDLNDRYGLSVELIIDGAAAFSGLRASYGLFSGVTSFFAMTGPKDDPDLQEKVGHCGERLVLEAVRLGLGTCWVGATFNRDALPLVLTPDRALPCVITLGNVATQPGAKERAIYYMIHHHRKSLESFYEVEGEAQPPAWFFEGVKAAARAPSAVNRQPVRFVWAQGQTTAHVEENAGYEMVDLGIAKLHFELAAGGRFALGEGGRFSKD